MQQVRVEREHLASRLKHSAGLPQRRRVIGDVVKNAAEGNHVKTILCEGQALCIGAYPVGPCLRLRRNPKPRPREVDADIERDVLSVQSPRLTGAAPNVEEPDRPFDWNELLEPARNRLPAAIQKGVEVAFG